MITRKLGTTINKHLKQFPVVVILGPRQVGKTTLAKTLTDKIKKPSVYIDLELPSDSRKLSDAESFLQMHQDKCVIIDEVQRMPELFALLRALTDMHRVPGRFILLGSASPKLIKGVSESLAGRAIYTELTPIGITELPAKITQDKHWFRGGFPEALMAKKDSDYSTWLESFITSYIERDLAELFDTSFSTATMRNFWSMLANANGGIWNAESFARALGISAPTVNRYLDYIEAAFLVHRLPAFFVNAKKRLVKAPKVYIRDSGLLHKLCEINSFQQLQGNLTIGASWEGYVVEQIKQNIGKEYGLFFYRTHDGAESDLVITQGIKPVACIEIKLSNSPVISKGFYHSVADLKTTHNFIITPAADSYHQGKDILICSLRDFLISHLAKIRK